MILVDGTALDTVRPPIGVGFDSPSLRYFQTEVLMSVAETKKILEFPNSETTSNHAYITRWEHEALFNKGYVVVPTQFLRHYARLKPYPLTSGEALFVLHLMEFKWDSKDPFPGYKTLAQRMGISDKMARRHAQSLETKKYLQRRMRIGRTNKFDLTPLFNALLNAVEKEKLKNKKKNSTA